nr:MAG TPA: hypothetical protein [Caudoviricetes sp.]
MLRAAPMALFCVFYSPAWNLLFGRICGSNRFSVDVCSIW